MKFLRSRAHQTGDTIVEVMVSMTILALVLGVAFATSRHSFQDGLDSSYRDQAQAYAEQQAELIKQLDSSGSLNTSYQSSTGFCIDPTTLAATAPTNGSCPLPVGSSGSSSSQYTLVDKYDSSREKYTIQVQWPSANTSVPNSITLLYKPQDSFVITPGAFDPPVSSIITPLNGGWPSLTTDWSGTGDPSAPTVPYNTSLHLSWSTVPSAQSCSGSTTPANRDPGWNGSKAIAGSYAVGPLTTNVTYNLACNPFGGGAAQTSSVPITVSTEPPPVTTITPTSQTINSGGSASFSWSSTNFSTGCSASGSWSGAKAASGSYNTGALTGPATYTYYLYCTGPGGDSPTVSATVTVNEPPFVVTVTGGRWYYNNGRANEQLDMTGTVNDLNTPGTTAWIHMQVCNANSSSVSVAPSNSTQSIGITWFPISAYYCGGPHNPANFQICATAPSKATVCSNYISVTYGG